MDFLKDTVKGGAHLEQEKRMEKETGTERKGEETAEAESLEGKESEHQFPQKRELANR